MSNQTHKHNPEKSKLDSFNLGFEYNRSVAEERRVTKGRTDSSLK